MNIKEKIFNIFWNYQNSLLFSTFSDCNQSRAQKIIVNHIKDDCVYHKYWYEPIHNFSDEPKHIQIDRCIFGLMTMRGCNIKCASYTPLNQEDN
jgi:hypothetical protein